MVDTADVLADEALHRGVNHAERLWALLTFEIWARIFLDGESPWSLELPLQRAA